MVNKRIIDDEDHESSESDDEYVPISYTEQVFKRRLATLTSLKTREGGDFERPEDFESRKNILATRVKLVTDLKLELRRRYETPSDLDEVKFALFEIIDTICETDKTQKEEDDRQARDPDLNRGQQFHHITTNGFLMTKLSGRDPFLDFLKLNENNPDLVLRPKIFGRKSNNDRSQLVTDMSFVDMIVSSSGMMLPVIRQAQPGTHPYSYTDTLSPSLYHTNHRNTLSQVPRVHRRTLSFDSLIRTVKVPRWWSSEDHLLPFCVSLSHTFQHKFSRSHYKLSRSLHQISPVSLTNARFQHTPRCDTCASRDTMIAILLPLALVPPPRPREGSTHNWQHAYGDEGELSPSHEQSSR